MKRITSWSRSKTFTMWLDTALSCNGQLFTDARMLDERRALVVSIPMFLLYSLRPKNGTVCSL